MTSEEGFSLVEMLVAITLLSVGISAMMALFVQSALSLHRSAKVGTAVTLAEGQMEIYRTVSFTGIRLDGTQIPTSGTNVYVSGHSSDSAVPPSTGQALGGQDGDQACPDTSFPAACDPVQSVVGPDGATYTLDTYIDYVNDDGTFSIRAPAAGLSLKLVTVVVRDPATNDILAIDSSAFQGG
jgi:prepilin-type N-terminal cleavage/methylation domain-containing protein